VILQMAGTAVVAAVLTAWIALTVANQFERGRKFIDGILQLDALALIPSWTFFAPDPGRTDTHVVYREVYEGGTLANWRALRLVSRPTMFGLSHGERRVAKGIVDQLPELLQGGQSPSDQAADQQVAGERDELHSASPAVMFTNAYLAALSLVTQEQHDAFAAAVQFALAISDSPEREHDSTLLFISAIHSLDVNPRAHPG